MTERTRHLTTSFSAPVLLALLVCLVPLSGCINLAANLIHAVTGNNRPAEYEGLEGMRVALVVSTDGGMATDAMSAMLTSYIHAALNTNVKKIDMVRQSEVERWIDSHSSSDADYLEVGKGVKADRVLAVEVMNLTLRDGATLYKGQSDITISVYDVPAGGKILYRKQIPEFTFPSMGGPAITDVSEAKFRARYLSIVARTISGLFYEVDATADFALDATAHTF